jgi:hypothetical protein
MYSNLLGTVSHGTMRPQDLVPAFLDKLNDISESDHPEANTAGAEYVQLTFPPGLPYPYLTDEDDDKYWESEECSDFVESLFDLLNDYAPDYCYFGAHQGDGSDYGFWVSSAALDGATRDGELPRIDDTSKLDTFEHGPVLEINDHGNATLWAKNEESWFTVWAVV